MDFKPYIKLSIINILALVDLSLSLLLRKIRLPRQREP